MRVRVSKVRDGLHPSEVVVSVQTDEGPEFLTVDSRAMDDGSVEIGYPIKQRDNFFLVELPRETMTGTWRVWVDRNEVSDNERVRVSA